MILHNSCKLLKEDVWQNQVHGGDRGPFFNHLEFWILSDHGQMALRSPLLHSGVIYLLVNAPASIVHRIPPIHKS